MRNDWTGHGGVVSQEESQIRNEKLLAEVQNLREIFAEAWGGTQLVHALHCRPRRGVFENEIAILTGSNSEFLKETRSMSTWLDVEQLHLVSKDSGRALRVLPLVRVGPSPQSANNACYFFNRMERDGGLCRTTSAIHPNSPHSLMRRPKRSEVSLTSKSSTHGVTEL